MVASTEVASTEVGTAGQLRANALGAADMGLMAVAGSAPAYSIAATTASLVAVVGIAAPAALLYCAIPMFGIAWAFTYLGRVDPNAGAAYSWVGRAIHPVLGFLSGWALVVAVTLFSVTASVPAGSVTLSLFSPKLANNLPLVTIVGAAWFLLMVYLVIRGVVITARAQWIMTGVEVTVLSVFAIMLFIHAAGHGVAHFSWSWFSFGHFPSVAVFASGALIAAFYYWGWDVAANLSEESDRRRKAATFGCIMGIIVVFVLFEAYAVIVNMALSSDQIKNNSGDILTVLGNFAWPGIGGKIMVLIVLLSTIATLETGLIMVSRSLFAMGRDHTMPKALGRTSPRNKTPWVATIVVAIVSLGLFVASNFLDSVATVLNYSINAEALQITVYYGLAGVAVVLVYRKVLFKSIHNFIFMGLWPLVGAGFMFWLFAESVQSLNLITNIIGVGLLAVAVIPIAIYWRKSNRYYAQKPFSLRADAEQIDDHPAG